MAGVKTRKKNALALSPIVEEKVVRKHTTVVDESLVLNTQRVRKPTSKMMDADVPPLSKVKKGKAFPDANSISEPIAKVKKSKGKPVLTEEDVSTATQGSTKTDGRKKKNGKPAEKQQLIKYSGSEDPVLSKDKATSDDDYVDNQGMIDTFWDDVLEGEHPPVKQENKAMPIKDAASSTDLDSNSDSEPEEVPKPRATTKPPSGKRKEAKKPSLKSATAQTVIKADVISFVVPSYNKHLSQEVWAPLEVSMAKGFEAAVTKVYATIRCIDKLPLMINMTKDKKADRYSFNMPQDWTFLVKHWPEEVVKKGINGCVTIFLPVNFMKSLVLSKKCKSTVAHLKATLKSEDVSVADITIDEDENLTHYDPSYARKEKELLEALSKCNKCKKFPCLLDKDSQHRRVTAQMVRTWTYALLEKARGVDLHTPSDTEMFKYFYHTQRQGARTVEDTPTHAPAPAPAPAPQLIYMAPLLGWDKHSDSRSLHTKSRHNMKRAASDDDDEGVIYPTIKEWLGKLQTGGAVTNVQGIYWERLTAKFASEDCLHWDIKRLASIPTLDVRDAFKLNANEGYFVRDELEATIDYLRWSAKKPKRAKYH